MHGPTCIFWANLTPFSLPQGGQTYKIVNGRTFGTRPPIEEAGPAQVRTADHTARNDQSATDSRQPTTNNQQTATNNHHTTDRQPHNLKFTGLIQNLGPL
jgi:hypothetical protein